MRIVVNRLIVKYIPQPSPDGPAIAAATIMDRTTRKPEEARPVTAEIGSEGGSYADRMNQVATFSGPANPNVSPVDAAAGRMAVATESSARGPLGRTSVGSADDTMSGMVRYPTEPPSPPEATEGRRIRDRRWRNALFGAAAGAAAFIVVSRLRGFLK